MKPAVFAFGADPELCARLRTLRVHEQRFLDWNILVVA